MSEYLDRPERSPEDISAKNAEIVKKSLLRNFSETIENFSKRLEEPGFENLVLKLLVDFVPVLGGLQKVYQARLDYNKYPLDDMSEEAESMRELARQRALIGAIECILDTTTAGLTGIVPDELITWLNRLKLYCKTKRRGQSLPWYAKPLEWIDIAGHLARALLKRQRIRAFVDDKVLRVRH